MTHHFKLLFVFVILTSLPIHALHAAPLKVESIVFKAKKTNLDFGEPITLPFVSASQPKTAKKINDYIFQSLKPYLTAYAKHLLLNDTAKFEQPSDITGQVYYGSIGQAAITLMIQIPYGYDNMLHAVYFYNQYRQPIELLGTGSEWAEFNSADKPQPIIKGTWQGDTLTGQWQGNAKTLPFKIVP